MSSAGGGTGTGGVRLKPLPVVKHIVLVLSGKGGVGKSTVAALLALHLHSRGCRVGLLDVDLCGPSQAKIFGCDNQHVMQCSEGWLPVYPIEGDTGLAVMSMAYLLPSQSDPIVWRGPKKTAMIRQFLSDVYWGSLDFLIIDTPPGTSDEHITTVEALQALKPDGAVLVTTPQAIAINDVRREITFCRKTNLPILGLVENMAGYVCPHCSECNNVFSTGGGQKLAEWAKVDFLGSLCIDPVLGRVCDDGSIVERFATLSSPSVDQFKLVVEKLKALTTDAPE